MIAGVYLVLLSVIWGYAMFEYGAVVRSTRMWMLAALGVAALTHTFVNRGKRAPLPVGLLRWATWLLPVYVALQLIPLPVGVLAILSPARAEAIRAFGAVGSAPSWAALSVLPEATLKHLSLVCGYTLMFLMMRDIGWQLSGRIWLTAVPIIVIGALEAALGLTQSFNGHEASGTYVNRDHYAALLGMTLPFAVMYPISIWRGVDKRRDFPVRPAVKMCFLFAMSGVILLGIIYSLSRMGFVAALFSLLVTGAAGRFGRRKKWVLSMALLVTGLLACFIFLPPDSFVGRFSQISSAEGVASEGRLALWRESLGVFRAFPVFGCGLGGFESVFMRYKLAFPLESDAYVHNDYLQFLIELGAAGFAIAAVLFGWILSKALRAASNGGDTDRRCVAIACAGAFAAIGMHSFVDFNLYTPANAMLLAWISGIAASLDITT